MKKILLLLLNTCLLVRLEGQICTSPQSAVDITGKNVQARILNGGDLFTDFNNGQFLPDPVAGGGNPSTIFAAGLWVGGVDPGGNLKLAAATYRNPGGNDFWAGPLDQNGMTDPVSCSNWDKLFRVTRTRIEAFRQQLPLFQNDPAAAIAQYPDIMGWPAYGNPFFAQVWGFDLPNQSLAPYDGLDNDAFYNPLKGDFPAVRLQGKPAFVPEEIIWCVFNDQGAGAMHSNSNGKPVQIEVQLTAWTFNCTQTSALDRTVFTSHKIINRALERLDSTFVGLWADVEIGCGVDDYAGCQPGLNCYFAYNADALDGSPTTNCFDDTPTFEINPPVQTVTFLNTSLDKFMVYNASNVGSVPPATADPSQPNQYYNYLTGRFRDGTPLTGYGSGYNPGDPASPAGNFAFPGDPAAVSAWTMCTANVPIGDRRVLGAHQFGSLAPGASCELTAAWTAHLNDQLPCNLGNTFAEVEALHTAYANGFNGPCAIVATQTPEQPGFILTPNPASDAVRVQYGDLEVRAIHLLGADGRLLRRWQQPGTAETSLDLSGLTAGVYTVQVFTDRRSLARKVCVVR